MTNMHYFKVEADKNTGEWFSETAEYLGEIDCEEFLSFEDTDLVHFDQHDGETFLPSVMADNGIKTQSNFAVAVYFK